MSRPRPSFRRPAVLRGSRLRATLVALTVPVLAAVTTTVTVLAAPTADAHDTHGTNAPPNTSSTAPADRYSPYVALGDSYTASPLTGPSAGPPPGCLRSTNNYPHLTAGALGIAPTQLTDVSCSGAQTKDFANAQAVTGGSNPPQYDALSPAARLVTVGIGGNDIGFGQIVTSCVSPTPFGTPCRDRYQGNLEPKIDALRTTLVTVLKQVHQRAPKARVLIVGYPAILPVTGPGCYPVVPYTAGDVAYLRGILTRLDGVIQKAAASGNATYVDTYTPTIGHDICQPPGVRWIEGLVPTSPAAPAHPNALGAAALSRAVLATLGHPQAAS